MKEKWSKMLENLFFQFQSADLVKGIFWEVIEIAEDMERETKQIQKG